LWPKTDEEKKKGRNSGFVQFATRSEAERAMDGMRDKEIMGQTPRLGWGRTPKHAHTFAPPVHSHGESPVRCECATDT
jgi:RNA recognition motif-containing protein